MNPSEALSLYLRDYNDKDGRGDSLLRIFQKIRSVFDCRRVLYPGSYLHITPSLVFAEVCYVDSLRNIVRAFADPALLEYVNRHKDYPQEAKMWCHEEDYSRLKTEPPESFDLLISLNAGFISQACKNFLRPGTLLLANDGHYDASRAYVDPDYQLIGAFEGQKLTTSAEELSSCFRTAKGEYLTLEMVEANSQRPPSKARFRPAQQASAYFFRKSQRNPKLLQASG